MILAVGHRKRTEPKLSETGLLLIHEHIGRTARMLQRVAKKEVMKSHYLGHKWVGPFGVAETRSRVQKQGGHCLSQASLPAVEFGEQRKHLPDHIEGPWFWVLLPNKGLALRDAPCK